MKKHILELSLCLVIVGLCGCGKKQRYPIIEARYPLDFSFVPSEDPWKKLSDAREAAKSGKPEDIFALAVQNVKMGFWDVADSAFIEAAERGANDVELMLQCGRYFEQYRKMPQNAIKLFKKAAELDSPLRDMAFYRLGMTYMRIGNVDKGIENWQKGAESSEILRKEWLEAAEIVNSKLNRPKDAEKILSTLSEKFPNEYAPVKRLLALAKSESKRHTFLEKLAEIEPFCEEMISSAFDKYSIADSAEIVRDAQKAKIASVEALMAGIRLIFIGNIEDGTDALLKFANTAEKKLHVANFLLERQLGNYAYRFCVAAFAQAKDERTRIRARVLGGVALVKSESVGLGSPLPKLFGGNEPDLFGGALSVLTDRYDIQDFTENIQYAENKFFAIRIGQEILEKFVEEYPNDSLIKIAILALEQLAIDRKDVNLFVKLSEHEYRLAKTDEEKFAISEKMLERFEGMEKYPDMWKNVLVNYGYLPQMEKLIDYTFWRVSYGVSKEQMIKLCMNVLERWNSNKLAYPVALSTRRALWRYLLYKLTPDEQRMIIRRLIDEDPYWEQTVQYAEKCLTPMELLAISEKYPFEPSYFRCYLKALTLDNRLSDYADLLLDSAKTDTSNIILLLRTAEAQYWVSRFETAFPLYKSVLARRPDCHWLRELSAEIARSLGDTTFALQCFAYLSAIQPDNQRWLERYGDIAEQGGVFADTIWATMIYNDPLNHESWGALAAVHWDYLRFDKGEQVIHSARKFFSNERLFAKEKGALLDWLGRYDEAFEEYLLGLEEAFDWETDEIAAHMEKLMRHSKQKDKYKAKLEGKISAELQKPQVLDLYVQYFLEEGDTNSVLKRLSRLAEKAKHKEVLNATIRWAQSLRKTEIQAKAYKRLFEITKDALHLKIASEILEAAGKNKDAEEAISKAAKENSKFKWDFGHFLMRRKDFSEAAKIFRQLAADDTLDADVAISLSRALMAQNKFSDARNVLMRYGERLKKLDETAKRKKYQEKIRELSLEVARTYISGNAVDALAAYERVINEYPTDIQILREAYLFACEKKLTQQLVKYYEEVSQKAHKNYRWNMILYWISRWEHKTKETSKWLAKACDNEPNNAQLWMMRFNTSFVQGDILDAKKAMSYLERLNALPQSIRIDMLLVLGEIDSAIALIEKPIREKEADENTYAIVIDELIERGMLKRAEKLASSLPQFEYPYRFLEFETPAKTAQLEENPEKAAQIFLNCIQSAKSSSWLKDEYLAKVALLFAEWHYIEEAIPETRAQLAKSIYAKDLLGMLYKYGGAVREWAGDLFANYPAEAIEALLKAEEYQKIVDLCKADSAFQFRRTRNADLASLAAYAVALWKTGNKARAERILISSPEFGAMNPYNYLKIADAFLQIGDYACAQKYAQKGEELQKYPDNRFQMLAFRIALASGDTTRAIRTIMNLPERERVFPDIWRIDALLEIGKRDEAIKLITKRNNYFARELSRGNYVWASEDDGLLAKYELYDIIVDKNLLLSTFAYNDWDKEDYLRRAVRYMSKIDAQKAIKLAENLLSQNPDDWRTIMIYADALQKSNRSLEAAIFLEKSDFATSRISRKIAELYYEAKKYEMANDALLSLLEGEVTAENYIYALEKLLENGQYDFAARIGKTAYRLWGGVPKIWGLYGEALCYTGKQESGMELIKRAAYQRYSPEVSDECIERWARITIKQNQAQQTIDWALQKLDDKNEKAHRRFAEGRLALIIAKQMGNKVKAFELARKLLARFPMDLDAHELFVEIAIFAGEQKEAKKAEKYIGTHFIYYGQDEHFYDDEYDDYYE